MSIPHDSLFKAAFEQPDIARSELRATRSDVLYALRTNAGQEALVYVLFEHQSSEERSLRGPV
jgi:predicted transposase YdaD